MNAVANWAEEVSLLVRSYYDIQTVRIEHQFRLNQLQNKGEAANKDVAEAILELGLEDLESAELKISKRIDAATKDHPVRVGFMSRVTGIGKGPILAGGVIAHIERRKQVRAILTDGAQIWVTAPELFPNPEACEERYKSLRVKEIMDIARYGIRCFDTMSKLWAYAGLSVDKQGNALRRQKGVRSNWSSTFKVLAWKIGQSFFKVGKSYRTEFEAYRDRIRSLHQVPVPRPEIRGRRWKQDFTDFHIRNMACRYVAKLFLSHVWQYWREMENLEARCPWALEHGHTQFKHWSEYCDK